MNVNFDPTVYDLDVNDDDVAIELFGSKYASLVLTRAIVALQIGRLISNHYGIDVSITCDARVFVEISDGGDTVVLRPWGLYYKDDPSPSYRDLVSALRAWRGYA
jgi:hypothetical protein